MPTLNFPSNPQIGDTYNIGTRTWIWNGYGWQLQSGITSFDPLTANRIIVTTSTNSTSTDTGALVVVGGVGIGADLFVGGNIHAVGNITADGNITIGDTTGTDTLLIGAEIISNLIPKFDNTYNLGAPGNTWAQLFVNSVVATSATITGTLFASEVYDNGTRVLRDISAGTDTAISSVDGVVKVWSTATLQSITERSSTTNQIITFTNTASANNVSSGALIVTGGVGIGGDLYASAIYDNNSRVVTLATLGDYGVSSLTAGTDTAISTSTGGVTIWSTATLQSITDRNNSTTNRLIIANTSNANSIESGAVVIQGGLSVEKDIFVGGNIHAVGNITADGNITIGDTTGSDTLTVAAEITSDLIPKYDKLYNLGAPGNTWDQLFVNSLVATSVTTVGNIFSSELYDNGNRVITSVTALAGEGLSGGGTITGPTGTVAFTNTGVLSLTAGTDTAISSTAGNILIWSTATLQSITERDSTTTNIITFASTASAINTESGAIVVTGGVGVGGSIYASEIYDDNSRVITQATLGVYGVSVIIAGTDTAVSTGTGEVHIWSTSTLQSITDRGATTTNVINIANSTTSTATDSGALIVDGGVGVGGSVYAGALYDNTQRVITSVEPVAGPYIGISSLTTSGPQVSFTIVNLGVQEAVAGDDISVSTSTGSVTISNISTLHSVTSRGNTTTNAVVFYNTSQSTDITSGAVVINGGLGVGGAIYASEIYDNNSRVVTQLTLGNYGVSTILAGTDTAISTATGAITIWNTSTLQSVSDRGNTTSNRIVITNLESSTSSNTGALQITGGVGLGEDLFVGKTVTVAGINTATSITSGAVVVTGGVGIGGDLFVGKQTKIQSRQSSINTMTGALVVEGGLGIGGDLYVGGGLISSGQLYDGNARVVTTATIATYAVTELIGGEDIAVTSSTGIVTVSNTSTLQSVTTRGNSTTNTIHILNTATSITTASNNAFEVDGGIAAAQIILSNISYINGSEILTTATGVISQFNGGIINNPLIINTNTQSTSTTTGALVVKGGVGIGGDLHVGGITRFDGSVFFNGTATYVLSTNTVYTDNLIELHTPPGGMDANWDFDDGRDIGLRFHFYTNGTDTNAALVLANDTKFLEFYGAGVESPGTTSTFIGSEYGTFKTGSVLLVSHTTSTNTATGALVVRGGVGVGGDVYAYNIYDNNHRVITAVTALAGTGLSGGGTITGPTGTVAFTNTGVLSLTSGWGIDLTTATGDIIITNTGVLSLTAGTDTVVSSTAGNITIWNTSTLQSITDRGAATTNAINITSLLQSNDTASGALQVVGGVGIGGNLNVGSNITATGIVNVLNTSEAISTATGALVVAGGVGVGGDVYASAIYDSGYRVLTAATIGSAGVSSIFAGTDTAISTATGAVTIWNTSTLQTITGRGATTTNAISITNLTSSIDTTTGALVVAGGVGIGGDVYANNIYDNTNRVITSVTALAGEGLSGGGTITGPTGTVAFTNTGVLSLTAGTDTAISSTAGNILIWNNSTLQSITNRGATTTNIITFANTLTSSTSTDGAVIIAGGVGVGKDAVVGGSLTVFGTERIANTTQSTGTISGALTVAGGVGVQGNVYASAIYDNTARVITTATIATYAVTNLTAGTDTAISTSTGAVLIWNTSTLQSITNRGASTNNALSLTNGSESTSTTNGTLVVTGGVGISKTLNAAIIYTPVFTATNATITSLTAGSISDTGGLTVSGITTITNITSATNTVSGALQVVGGVGIQGSLYADGIYDDGLRVLTAANLGGFGVTNLFAGTDTAISTATGAITIWGTSTLQSVSDRGATSTNAISLTNTTSSTSTNTGALVVTGGVGVGGALYSAGVTSTVSTGTSAIKALNTFNGQQAQLVSDPTVGTQIRFGTTVAPTLYGTIGAYNGFINIQGGAGRDIKIYGPASTASIYVSATTGNVGINRPSTTYTLDVNGTLNVSSAAISTSTTTGALLVAGGVGVGGNLYATAIYDNRARVVTTATISSLAVTSLIAGTDTAISTSTGAVTIWNTSTLDSITGRSGSTENTIYLTSTTQYSTSSIAGNQLQVSGGIGTNILFISGSGWINDQEIVTTATANASVIAFNGGTINNALTINSGTNATTTSSGALIVRGGAGIGRDLVVGGDAFINGGLYIGGTSTVVAFNAIVTQDKTLTLANNSIQAAANGSGIQIGSTSTPFITWLYDGVSAWQSSNNVIVRGTTAASTTATGALIVAGGVGVGSNLYVSGLGTVASPATISVTGAGATANGDAQLIIGQNPGALDIKLLIAGVDSRADGLTANDAYLQTAQRLNIQNKGNGTSYNTGITLGAAGASAYADIILSAASVNATAVERLRVNGSVGWVKVSTTIAATSTATGSLIVAGGAGIGGNAIIGGSVVTTGTITALTTNSSITVLQNNAIWTNGGISGSTLYITNTTTSVSSSTGAAVIAGGVGVANDMWVGGAIYSGGLQVLTSSTLGSGGVGVSTITAGTDTAVSASSGAITIWDTATLQSISNRGASTDNIITISTTTAATSTTTGALVIAGGVGIGGNIVMGSGGVARGTSDIVYSSGAFATPGDAQAATYTLRWVGASALAFALTSDAGSAGASNQIVLPNNAIYTFKVLVTAKSTTSADSGGWEFNGVATRAAGVGTMIIRTVNKTKIWTSNAAWDANVVADTTNGAIQITGKGDGTNTVRFVSRVDTVEVTN